MLSQPLWLRDVAALSFQAAVLVLAGGVALHLLRLRVPKVRLIFWQLLLAGCLALPLLDPWEHEPVAQGPAQVVVSIMQAVTPAAAPVKVFPWAEWILAVLVAGAALRLVWVCLGLIRLRSYRSRSRPFGGAESPIAEAQRLAAASARLYVSPELASPATFGIRSPAVLLPERILSLSPAQQRAVVCHEFLHVRRRDWAWNLAEEFLLCLFWFHPAIWWAVRNIRLSREQTVDAEVVHLTQARKDYLAALLEIAQQSPNARLVSAALFLRENQLAARVALLVKEVAMSKRRLVVGCVVSAAVLLATGVGAARAWPLRFAALAANPPQATSPADRVSGGVEGGVSGGMSGRIAQGVKTVPHADSMDTYGVGSPGVRASFPVSSGLKLIHTAFVKYPRAAWDAQGTIMLKMTVDTSGKVSDLRAFGHEPVLAQAALKAIWQWRFEPPKAPVTTIVTVYFRRPRVIIHGIRRAPAAEQAAPGPSPARDDITETPSDLKLIQSVTPVYPPLARMARIQSAVVLEVTVDAEGNVTGMKVLSGHPLLIHAAEDAVKQFKFAPPSNPPATTTVTTNFRLPPRDDAAPAAQPNPPAAPPPPPAHGAIYQGPAPTPPDTPAGPPLPAHGVVHPGPTPAPPDAPAGPPIPAHGFVHPGPAPAPPDAPGGPPPPQGAYELRGNPYYFGGPILRPRIGEPRVIYAPDPPYTKEARDAKLNGDVTLAIMVGTDGRVKSVKEVSALLGKGLDKSAIKPCVTGGSNPARGTASPSP
ncbi:MAG: TonB family protein [Terriglobia bacterium]